MSYFFLLFVTDKPGEAHQSNPLSPIYDELNLALTTKYGDFKLFYCAEADCVEGSTEGPLRNKDVVFSPLRFFSIFLLFSVPNPLKGFGCSSCRGVQIRVTGDN